MWRVSDGVLGLFVAVLSGVLAALLSPVARLGLIGTGVAWRGCPTRWTVGLMGAPGMTALGMIALAMTARGATAPTLDLAGSGTLRR